MKTAKDYKDYYYPHHTTVVTPSTVLGRNATSYPIMADGIVLTTDEIETYQPIRYIAYRSDYLFDGSLTVGIMIVYMPRVELDPDSAITDRDKYTSSYAYFYDGDDYFIDGFILQYHEAILNMDPVIIHALAIAILDGLYDPEYIEGIECTRNCEERKRVINTIFSSMINPRVKSAKG